MRSTQTLSILTLAGVLACGGIGGGSGDVDTAMLRRAGGDVLLEGGGRLPYEITSDRYRQWQAARQALRAQGLGFTMRIDPLRVTESDIQRAVSYFERNRRARHLIEDTGLSVRDYVLTTIALEQQMAVATGRWGERERPRVPAAPVAPAESISAELARDTAPRVRVDTVPVVDTVVVPDTTAPPDTTTAPSSGPPAR